MQVLSRVLRLQVRQLETLVGSAVVSGDLRLRLLGSAAIHHLLLLAMVLCGAFLLSDLLHRVEHVCHLLIETIHFYLNLNL